MYFEAIAIHICDVHSDNGEDTVSSSSSQYSELTLKLQSAEFIAAAAAAPASWNIMTAAVLVIQGRSVKLVFISNPDLSKQLQVSF